MMMRTFDVADGHQLQASNALELAEAIVEAHQRCVYDQSAWRINRLVDAGEWNAYLAGGWGAVSPEFTVVVTDRDSVARIAADLKR
jgi:hypothetical protein